MTTSAVHMLPLRTDADLHALRPWGAVRTLILSVVTFGLLPLLIWRRQWARQLDAEQQFLQKAVGLMALPTDSKDVAALRHWATRSTEQWLASLVIGLCVITIFWFLLLWQGHEGWNLDALLASTYLFEWRSATPFTWRRDLFTAWTVGLSLAYAAHWAALQWHVARLQKFTLQVNRALDAHAGAPVALPQIGTGLTPRWIIGAVVMVLLGGYWGILAMMAAGAQRQYVRRAAPRWRHAMPSAHGQMTRQAASLYCVNPHCRKTLSNDAQYCPRCGAKV